MSAGATSIGWTKAKRIEAAKRAAATRARNRARRAAALRDALDGGPPLMTAAERAALQGGQRERVLEGAAIGETIARAIASLREREEGGEP